MKFVFSSIGLPCEDTYTHTPPQHQPASEKEQDCQSGENRQVNILRSLPLCTHGGTQYF